MNKDEFTKITHNHINVMSLTTLRLSWFASGLLSAGVIQRLYSQGHITSVPRRLAPIYRIPSVYGCVAPLQNLSPARPAYIFR
jgi:hypothetical protein